MLVYRIESEDGQGAYMARLDRKIKKRLPREEISDSWWTYRLRNGKRYEPRDLPGIMFATHTVDPDMDFEQTGTRCAWRSIDAMVEWFVPEVRCREALALCNAILKVLYIDDTKYAYWADAWQIGYYEHEAVVVAEFHWGQLLERDWRRKIRAIKDQAAAG